MRTPRLAWMFGLAAVWLLGCSTPCETTAQCGDDGMCVAALCQPLACEKTLFAVNPESGECVPLSGCFLTEEQRGWRTCSDDPCLGQDEATCVTDSRCQPVYSNPKVEPNKTRAGGGAVDIAIGCGVANSEEPKRSPDGQAIAAGVNNGEAPKHRQDSTCFPGDNSARVFSLCRAVPSIPKQTRCEQLSKDQCKTRRDCLTDPPNAGSVGPGVPTSPVPAPGPVGQTGGRDVNGAPADAAFFDRGECFTRHEPPSDSCAGASARSCLLSRDCQPIGSSCFCPPGGRCDCGGGEFLACETNDRLRRCTSNAECGASERCDNDEACVRPRTFASPPTGDAQPGSPGCVGACVPKGCAGMGERMCNERAECDGGSYGTVCRPKPYCRGGGGDIVLDLVPEGGSCGCDAEFVGCGEQKPTSDLRAERSLLVRDPEIIDDPAFTLERVLTKLAPAGKVDDFTRALVRQIGESKTLSNGARAEMRRGYSIFLKDLSPETAGVTSRLAGVMHPTALINRIDLAKSGTCGEARLTYALTRAYTDGNQRMTLIVELRVPDDGNGCRTVAQRWAELSLVDSAAERRRRLIALYDELLSPANLGQLRTNEFLNRTALEPWELREFHLDAGGLPELSPVAQSVDAQWRSNSDFLAWVRSNAAAIHDGNAEVPRQYLAASSREDGGRLLFAGGDSTLQTAEKDLNAQSCAGCHLTETKSPFVHIGERLGKRLPGTMNYQPVGRAVIDSFMQKELVSRAKGLRQLLSGAPRTLAATRPTGLARVH